MTYDEFVFLGIVGHLGNSNGAGNIVVLGSGAYGARLVSIFFAGTSGKFCGGTKKRARAYLDRDAEHEKSWHCILRSTHLSIPELT